jgi:hypothetical protein
MAPERKTTAACPGVKLTGCSAVSALMRETSPRNGMYSPNGTSCRLAYRAVGPRPGSQSWPTLRCGLFSTSPTRIGRPIALTAADTSW